MTPDELVAEIFRIQEERNPDADPGDITIDIQDDMPLVMVRQDNMPFITKDVDIMIAQGCGGGSIQAALERYLQEVIDGTR